MWNNWTNIGTYFFNNVLNAVGYTDLELHSVLAPQRLSSDQASSNINAKELLSRTFSSGGLSSNK